MRKMLFIMNPFAGMRKANRHLVDIIGVFNRADYDVRVYMTACQGDAERIAREWAAEVDMVACAGGDGTFNETINGVLKSGADVPIGYIPCGSTNDFASSLHLPTNPVKAAQLIVEGAPKRYDVGKFADRYFSYVASFGVFTKASYATPQNVKNALGHTAYLLEGIQEISQLKTSHVRIELEDREIEGDFLFGAISNSTSVGGILTLDPKQVDMTDGEFELLLVRSPKNLQEVSECLLALQKQQYNCAMMTFLSTPRLAVYASAKMPWTLDGEREDGHEKVEVENIHEGIQIITKG